MELEDVDYGAWRCDLKIYSSRSYGTVLRVDYPDSRENNNTKDEMVKIRTEDVYVKRGDPFTVNSRHKSETIRVQQAEKPIILYNNRMQN